MNIEYKLKPEELVNFHMKHMTNTTNFIITYKQNTIMVLTMFLLWFFVSYDFVLKLGIIFYTCLLLLILKKHMLKALKKAMKRLYSTDSNKNYFERTTLSTQKDGIVLTTTYAKKQFKWESLRNLYQVNDFIFIRTYTNNYIYIPLKTLEITKFLDVILTNTNLELEKSYPKDMTFK